MKKVKKKQKKKNVYSFFSSDFFKETYTHALNARRAYSRALTRTHTPHDTAHSAHAAHSHAQQSYKRTKISDQNIRTRVHAACAAYSPHTPQALRTRADSAHTRALYADSAHAACSLHMPHTTCRACRIRRALCTLHTPHALRISPTLRTRHSLRTQRALCAHSQTLRTVCGFSTHPVRSLQTPAHAAYPVHTPQTPRTPRTHHAHCAHSSRVAHYMPRMPVTFRTFRSPLSALRSPHTPYSHGYIRTQILHEHTHTPAK